MTGGSAPETSRASSATPAASSASSRRTKDYVVEPQRIALPDAVERLCAEEQMGKLFKAMAYGMLIQQFEQIPIEVSAAGSPLKDRAEVMDTVLALLESALDRELVERHGFAPPAPPRSRPIRSASSPACAASHWSWRPDTSSSS